MEEWYSTNWGNRVANFDVRKSAHHHTIQIIQPTRCNSFTSLLLDVYVWLNMFRAPLLPLSGAYNCTRSLWIYRWIVAVGTLLVVVCRRFIWRAANGHNTVHGNAGQKNRQRTGNLELTIELLYISGAYFIVSFITYLLLEILWQSVIHLLSRGVRLFL